MTLTREGFLDFCYKKFLRQKVEKNPRVRLFPGLPGSVCGSARRANRLKWEDLRGKGFVVGEEIFSVITC